MEGLILVLTDLVMLSNKYYSLFYLVTQNIDKNSEQFFLWVGEFRSRVKNSLIFVDKNRMPTPEKVRKNLKNSWIFESQERSGNFKCQGHRRISLVK